MQNEVPNMNPVYSCMHVQQVGGIYNIKHWFLVHMFTCGIPENLKKMLNYI